MNPKEYPLNSYFCLPTRQSINIKHNKIKLTNKLRKQMLVTNSTAPPLKHFTYKLIIEDKASFPPLFLLRSPTYTINYKRKRPSTYLILHSRPFNINFLLHMIDKNKNLPQVIDSNLLFKEFKLDHRNMHLHIDLTKMKFQNE